MNISELTELLMWCTVINAGLLFFSFFTCAYAGNFVYRIHSHWFPMPRETFNIIIYSLLGIYKIMFVVFFAVPYIVLLILT
jgi:hypothetical protein